MTDRINALQILLLTGAAIIGSALNAIAGGGSFFTFPALIFTGVPILNANATSTIALWPGAVSSAYSYREQLKVRRAVLLSFIVVSVIGSVAGTWLLLVTPADVLKKLLPYLMLSATLLLVFKNNIAKNSWLAASEKNIPFVMCLQFIIGVYGGYFGGGMGILMLATFSLMGFSHLPQMNALKSFLGAFINGVAVFIFIVMNKIFWCQASLMIAGAIAGGFLGAYLGTRVKQVYLHWFIIVVGAFFTVYFFAKGS